MKTEGKKWKDCILHCSLMKVDDSLGPQQKSPVQSKSLHKLIYAITVWDGLSHVPETSNLVGQSEIWIIHNAVVVLFNVTVHRYIHT